MRLMLMLLLAVLTGGCDRQKPEGQQGEPVAGVPQKGIDRSRKGQPFPATAIVGPEAEETSLAEFRGAPTLVNLWATWCAPCVKELPTLERLEANSKGRLRVVAVSQDMAPRGSVEAFLEQHELGLPLYQDDKMALSGALGADVLPTTILYDSSGRELWRYVGDLDWTGAEAAKLLAEAR